MVEHLAIASEECFVCWLVLPFRERNYHCTLCLEIFNAGNCILFTISASGLFLKFSYQIYCSYKKERVYTYNLYLYTILIQSYKLVGWCAKITNENKNKC